jgi:hypothetical protein
MTTGLSRNRRWLRRELDPLGVDRIMREVGFSATADRPTEGHAMVDRGGNMRRVHAVYPDGWRVTLTIKKSGEGSLSWVKKVCTVRVTCRPENAA